MMTMTLLFPFDVGRDPIKPIAIDTQGLSGIGSIRTAPGGLLLVESLFPSGKKQIPGRDTYNACQGERPFYPWALSRCLYHPAISQPLSVLPCYQPSRLVCTGMNYWHLSI